MCMDKLSDFWSADYVDLLAALKVELQSTVDQLHADRKEYELQINTKARLWSPDADNPSNDLTEGAAVHCQRLSD